jgi:hypothetical protein
MTGRTNIRNNSGRVTAEGQTNIQNAKVRGMELGYPITAQYDLTDDLPTEVIMMRKLIVKLGPTPIEMSGTLETKSSPAHIDVNVKANNVSVAEVRELWPDCGWAATTPRRVGYGRFVAGLGPGRE